MTYKEYGNVAYDVVYSPGYKEYDNVFLDDSEMAACALYTHIYVATTLAGVYYTGNYTDEGTQPTWVDVSDGLDTLDCKEFHIDPFDPVNRQYVLVTTGYKLYRRVNGGSWEEILTPTDCANLIGCTDNGQIGGFCLNPTIPGKIWVTFGAKGVVEDPDCYWALYSDDYGDTWYVGMLFFGSSYYTYGLGSVRAYDDALIISADCSPFGCSAWYSENNGLYIDNADGTIATGAWTCGFNWDPLHDPRKIYYWSNNDGGGLHSIDIGVHDPAGHWENTKTLLVADIYPDDWGAMWFDPDDELHQRALSTLVNTRLYITLDAWATPPTLVNCTPHVVSLNPVDINGEVIVGLLLDHGGHEHHIIGIMTDETDTAPVGIAGANCDTAPFTDSIPDTCGAVCRCGIQAFVD